MHTSIRPGRPGQIDGLPEIDLQRLFDFLLDRRSILLYLKTIELRASIGNFQEISRHDGVVLKTAKIGSPFQGFGPTIALNRSIYTVSVNREESSPKCSSAANGQAVLKNWNLPASVVKTSLSARR